MTREVRDWVDSLADAPGPMDQVEVSREEWFQRAAGRPEWMLWGKARESSSCPAHPLMWHMVDVAAVASRLVTDVLPPSVRQELLTLAGDPVSSLRALLIAIGLHDLGKATPAFQAKVSWAREGLARRGFDLRADGKARHHGDIGCFLLREALGPRCRSDEVGLALARAVSAHHGQFPTNTIGLKSPGRRERGEAGSWAEARKALVSQMEAFLGLRSLSELRAPDHARVVGLAGLTSVADWLGSMDDVFTYQPPGLSVPAYWSLALGRADRALAEAGLRKIPRQPRRSFTELFPGMSPWPLHCAVERVGSSLEGPSLTVIEAPMGEGKTEAALILADSASALAGSSGVFIGLPTQATANQMFGRVASFLDQNSPSVPSSLLLAHGEADLVERFKNLVLESIHDPGVDGESTGRADSLRAESWFLSKKRTLLAGHAVGTIDQALLAVMRIRHAFVRLFGLSGKTVILDEVHAYDTYTSTLLERLLEWLGALGTSVVTLSATLPSERRQALIGAYTRGAGADSRVCNHVPYPRITVAGPSGVKAVGFGPRANSASARIIRCAADIDSLAAIVVEQARAGSCVGWVCNTVARSQTAMERVRALMPELEERLLLHSRLLPTERQRRELRLEGWLGKPSRDRVRPKRCVVVGTQVLEQSLDVDFDVLVSDVAPIDLLLQRMGRLWRHERRDRGAVAERCVYVACPTGNWKDARLERVAGVYAESVVRRTLELLENRGVITIPDEIESLVEQVYSGEQPPRDDALSDAWFDEFAERATERVLAAQKLMPRPTVEDDPFGNLQVWLDDEDDPVLNDQLRAVTRLGPRTVDVVCVERKGDRLSLGDGDDETLDLGVEPDRTLAARLVRRSIGLSHSRVVSALLDEDPPEGWKRSPLLRYRRLVAFERGEATIGGVRLLLDDELGLRIGNERSS